MLSINNLNLQYGKKHLFRDVCAQVHGNDKIGLVGVNGSGKTTLFRIMSRELETDSGVVSRSSRFSVACLPQEVTIALGDKTLYEEAEIAYADILKLQEELDTIATELSIIDSGNKDMEPLLQRQGELQHLLDGFDVFRIRSQIERVLFGLGFSRDDLEKKAVSFSGGWIMRLILAKLLLQRPSLLLLDEPTNHLDLDSLTWLENFLLQYQGAVIVISHDRTFLDRVTSITWELSLGRLNVFRGNYSHYLAEKEQRLEIERAAWANQQAKIKQTERFIERFRSKSTKARQVQSRVKQLEKMERIELSENDRSIHFFFPPAAQSGRDVLEVAGLCKKFDDKSVFSNLSFFLQRGDKLAVVGVNGSGKTTLLKILAGLESSDGNFRFGHNVTVSYFGQHQAQELTGENTIIETVYNAAKDMNITQVRSLLGAFLFSGDEVEKQIKVLSGGEKSRVALARMLVHPANMMLLDEPTNHLDISSQEVLLEAMSQYEGTVIVVSHNRYFINGFVNKVLEIRNGKATLYEGNLDDYLASRKQSENGVDEKEPALDAKNGAVSKSENLDQVHDRKALRQLRAKKREDLGKKLKPWREKVMASEELIEGLEKRKEELETIMADPGLYSDSQKWAEISQEYDTVKRRLDRLYTQWEEAQEQIEIIENINIEM